MPALQQGQPFLGAGASNSATDTNLQSVITALQQIVAAMNLFTQTITAALINISDPNGKN